MLSNIVFICLLSNKVFKTYCTPLEELQISLPGQKKKKNKRRMIELICTQSTVATHKNMSTNKHYQERVDSGFDLFGHSVVLSFYFPGFALLF